MSDTYEVNVESTFVPMYPVRKIRITFNQDQFGGLACVRGLRITVSDVLELLAEDLVACRAYAAQAQHPMLIAAVH
jgi:uncharacterized protein (DUF433 family)